MLPPSFTVPARNGLDPSDMVAGLHSSSNLYRGAVPTFKPAASIATSTPSSSATMTISLISPSVIVRMSITRMDNGWPVG